MMRRAVRPAYAMMPALTQVARMSTPNGTKMSVIARLVERRQFSEEFINQAVAEFLGFDFDKTYLAVYNDKAIAEHIHGYMCAKAEAKATGHMRFAAESDDRAFYLGSADEKDQLRVLAEIDQFLAAHTGLARTHSVSCRSYHSGNGPVLYTVEYHPFTDPTGDGKTFEELTTAEFMKKSTTSIQRYKEILERLSTSIKPVFIVSELASGVNAVNMAFHADRAAYFTSVMTLITAIPGASVQKKFVETFSNNTHVYSFYVKGATVEQLKTACSRITLLPNRPNNHLTELYNARRITEDECIYGHSIALFAHYFTPPVETDDFLELQRGLRGNETLLKRLRQLRSELFQEVMSETAICEAIRDNVHLFKKLYKNFSDGATSESIAEMRKFIDLDLARSPYERNLFRTFLRFNEHVVRTNFFKADKAAVAYRLNPKFIAGLDYPQVPFGIYCILGGQFRGFHIRFHDIARGGVRMIKSNSSAVYKRNKRTLFNENYNLAYTQMLKNKDIPESGSKGTMLVSTRWDARREEDLAKMFLQYVDALLDCMLEDGTTGSLKSQELLFLGPDEGTAGDYPSRAAHYAKARGFPAWKSLTTGKLPSLGGIPHDVDGMTTMSVRQYALGIYRELGLDGKNLTKFITGGPDGDLGSNEIKQGNEKIVAMCDGSASIYDPEGINDTELRRLATERKLLKNFKKDLLSKNGFIVMVTDRDVTLPDGTQVPNGETFRNDFHFSKYVAADTFIPCGGRPASVTLENVARFIAVNPGSCTGEMLFEGNISGLGELKFKYIIEGANLFITQDARIALENCGIHLFKDSSANKGGVTSSSIEVYTGLALSDAEHSDHMCVKDPNAVPAFYQSLVKDIVARIADNAQREFQAIWDGSKKGQLGGKKTLISDRLSAKIVQIYEFIGESSLHKEEKLFRYVLSQYTPETVKNVVPLNTIIERVPRSYLNAIFCRAVANQFVFSVGLDSNEFAFFQFMRTLMQQAEEWAATSTK